MKVTSESEVNSFDVHPSLREVFKHDYDRYLLVRFCHCEVEADMMTSTIKGNLGRRFYTCSTRRCRYFSWHDGVFPQRCVKLINKLRDCIIDRQCIVDQQRIINQQRLQISNSQWALKLSVGFNVVLMMVIAYFIGKMS
ncbi:hypothetical protein ACFE04_007954 [Oxalis oulophora]